MFSRIQAIGLFLASCLLAISAHAADVSRGQQLYQANCVVCHGSNPAAASPRLAANNPSALNNAMNLVTDMGFLRGVLTQTDVNDIAAYIGSVVNPQPGNIEPQNGWYWNPNESGRGFFVEKRGSNIFMSGFMYADSGRATWFVAVGSYSNNRFSASMQTYANGQTLTGAYQAPVSTTPLGTVTLDFTAADKATMTWPGGTVALQRFPFGPNGAVTAPAAGAPESGWWWAKNESGRGYALEVQGSNVFVVGYMYESSGNPLWYLASGGMSNVARFDASWQQYANGQTLTGAYKPAQQTNANVGSLGISFNSTTTGTMTMPDGRQVAIERFVF